MTEILLEIKDLKKYFPIKKGIVFRRQVGSVRAVDGVSFDIRKGETLGLVGESGCGKSTLGRTLLQLYKATSGEIVFEGTDLRRLNGEELRMMRQRMQIIFQDPYASLNSRMTISEIVGEPLVIFNRASSKEIEQKVCEILELVGLDPEFRKRYPHEFSGGQRQRISIARALSIEPSFIVCDEPISALDVSIQAQVMNLLEDLQKQLGLTYLFIAHDLSSVRHISDRVSVMYLGIIVEIASREDLYDNPKHPYSQALLSAVPIPDPKVEKSRKRILLEGDIPSPSAPPSGCRFRTRCSKADDLCVRERPEFQIISNGHQVACHYC